MWLVVTTLNGTDTDYWNYAGTKLEKEEERFADRTLGKREKVDK